ncbi:WD40-repeat-containing domain protein [Lipomyces japonicus]|uniref:WD40-repeat-containing domain protein n=1 Tax=Lipomyces japonicus TaxID=56871 RepID=UPI0034CDA6B5
MKAHALTLHWHTDNQPIYSAHFQPTRNGRGRLATASGDNNVRIWSVEITDNGTFPTVTYLSTLTKHTQAVNVVRFDNSGDVLASAGDDGNVIIWAISQDVDDKKNSFGEDADASLNDKEVWRIKHLCRSSMAEIYDLAWSPDSQYLIAGSMDNVARIYSASTGLCVRQIAEHNHYVQGVAWDPLNEYVATQSSDRNVHIYTLKSKDGQFVLNPHHKISKAELPYYSKLAFSTSSSISTPAVILSAAANQDVDLTTSASQQQHATASESPILSAPGTPSSNSLPMNPPPVSTHSRRSSFGNSPSVRRSPSPSPALPLPAVRQLDSPKLGFKMAQLYHNEGLTSFFRRLTFTPDGSLLLTPAGQFKFTTPAGSEEVTNTVYIYTRAGINRPPVAQLPTLKKPAIVVKCCPIKYKLRTAREEQRPTQNITIDTSAIDGLQLQNLSEPVEKGTASSSLSSIPSTTTVSSSKQAFVLPYRYLYAVATQDSVFVYDTQQTTPLCIISNLHYATFTDLTWSTDGRILFMTSTDGFCSVVVFEPAEIGEAYMEVASTGATNLSDDKGDYYLPTPALTFEDSHEDKALHASGSSNSNNISSRTTNSTHTNGSSSQSEQQQLTPIISPVPSIASSSSSSAAELDSLASAGKREPIDSTGPVRKKKRVAPMLIGEVRK